MRDDYTPRPEASARSFLILSGLVGRFYPESISESSADCATPGIILGRENWM